MEDLLQLHQISYLDDVGFLTCHLVLYQSFYMTHHAVTYSYVLSYMSWRLTPHRNSSLHLLLFLLLIAMNPIRMLDHKHSLSLSYLMLLSLIIFSILVVVYRILLLFFLLMKQIEILDIHMHHLEHQFLSPHAQMICH